MKQQTSIEHRFGSVERLRQEGVTIPYESLNESQKEAFRRILYSLFEAIKNVGHSNPQEPYSFRPNNVIFISGERGSGKTCLLHSFMRYARPKIDRYASKELNALLEHESERRKEALETVRDSVIWLPTIDVDPITKDFDLLSNVLTRFRHAIQSKSRFLNSHDQDQFTTGDTTRLDLNQRYEQLLVDASQAWNGGMLGAGLSNEPELFAVRSESLAEASVKFAHRFREFIDAVGNQVFNSETAIFVLPIDDTDLKPAISLNILKLLRMLYAPRLFVIAMGDIRQFELVSSLEMMSNLGIESHVNLQALLPVDVETVRRNVSAMTSNALRKLIPPDQRIDLDSWTENGLKFRPSKAERTIEQLLDLIPIVWDDHIRPVYQSEKVRADEGTEIVEFDTYDETIENDERKMPMSMPFREFLQPLQGRAWKKELGDAVAPFIELTRKLYGNDETTNSENIDQNSEDGNTSDWNTDQAIEYFAFNIIKSSARRLADLWFCLRRLQATAERIDVRLKTMIKRKGGLLHKDTTGRHGSLRGAIRKADKGQSSNPAMNEDYKQARQDFDRLWNAILKTFRKLCQQSLMEEEVLNVTQREAVNRAFDEHSDQFDWSHLPLTLRPTWSTDQSMPVSDKRQTVTGKKQKCICLTTGATLSFRFTTPRPWTVETASEREVQQDVQSAQIERRNQFETYNYRPISTDTAAMITLYHDLLKFSPRGDYFHARFADMSVYEGLPWAMTVFEIGPSNKCTLYWPSPPCVTVYGLDWFAHLWTKMTNQDRKSKTSVENYILAWIEFGCCMVESSNIDEELLYGLSRGDTKPEMFQKVRVHLKRCAQKALRLQKDRPNSHQCRNYQTWLLNCIALTMPEFGASGELRRKLLFTEYEFLEWKEKLQSLAEKKIQPDRMTLKRRMRAKSRLETPHSLIKLTKVKSHCELLSYMILHRRAIRGQRARRLAKLVWLGLPHTAVRLAFADPNLYGPLTRLTRRGFFRAFHFTHDQHAKLLAGLLFYNDDQRVAESKLEDVVTSRRWSIDQTLELSDLMNPSPVSTRILSWVRQESKRSGVICPDRALFEVVRTAAASQEKWDSSRDDNRIQKRRRNYLKRLWWLENRKPQEGQNGKQKNLPYLTKKQVKRIVKSFDKWQVGRGLTPSAEDIETAGKTTYGASNWEEVSLKKHSYDLDFAEESYFRK